MKSQRRRSGIRLAFQGHRASLLSAYIVKPSIFFFGPKFPSPYPAATHTPLLFFLLFPSTTNTDQPHHGDQPQIILVPHLAQAGVDDELPPTPLTIIALVIPRQLLHFPSAPRPLDPVAFKRPLGTFVDPSNSGDEHHQVVDVIWPRTSLLTVEHAYLTGRD